MSDDTTGFAIRGTFMHAPRREEIEILEDAVVSVDASGIIDGLYCSGEAGHAEALAEGRRRGVLTELPEGRFLLPGMVDLHIHAPQWPQLGKCLHLPLEEWLVRYTFPLEARYADSDFAERVYTSLVETLLANGTTTAVYYATVHLPSTMRLADICLARGQRAFVGKVAMDDPEQCPDYYRDPSADAAIAGTRDLISYVRTLPGNENALVRPMITPRFIPSCTDPLLEGLGALAGESGCFVQTHCSEGDWEHAFVLERYGRTDTQSLDDLGLLRRGTILGHAILLSGADMDLIGQAGAGISHCPLSNYYFSNAVFPLRAALDKGVQVGLGTDISGGASPSLLDTCRHAVNASRALEDGVNPALDAAERGRPGSRIDFRTAFWLATAGGRRRSRSSGGALRARLLLRRDARRHPPPRQQPRDMAGCRHPGGCPSEDQSLQRRARRHPEGLGPGAPRLQTRECRLPGAGGWRAGGTGPRWGVSRHVVFQLPPPGGRPAHRRRGRTG